MRRHRPSPATAIALLALFVALGGTAIAASRYVITRTSQIKPSVLSAVEAPGPDVSVATKPTVRLEPGHLGASAEVKCPSNYHVVSGGYFIQLAPGAYVAGDEPTLTTGWLVVVNTLKSASASEVIVHALCAPGRVALLGG
jgi:hypothetical protein